MAAAASGSLRHDRGCIPVFAAVIGRGLAWILVPCGLGFWQIAVALLAGISAKEVVVSSTAVLFGIANVNSFGGMQQLHQELLQIGFGPLNAWCMMLFCLLYVPCLAALATIRREGGTRQMIAGILLSWELPGSQRLPCGRSDRCFSDCFRSDMLCRWRLCALREIPSIETCLKASDSFAGEDAFSAVRLLLIRKCRKTGQNQQRSENAEIRCQTVERAFNC